MKKEKRGFTIIEVVLVLAIAGLIFMMVFIALPALQRSQRDTQRRNDMGRMQTAIQNYQANNRGRLPGTNTQVGDSSKWGQCGEGADNAGASGFCANYLVVGGDYFVDPDGTAYIFADGGSGYAAGNAIQMKEFNHQVYITTNATCDGETLIESTGTQKVALRYKLEGGGLVCLSN